MSMAQWIIVGILSGLLMGMLLSMSLRSFHWYVHLQERARRRWRSRQFETVVLEGRWVAGVQPKRAPAPASKTPHTKEGAH